MNEDNSNNFDPNDMDFHKRLKGLAKNLLLEKSIEDERKRGTCTYWLKCFHILFQRCALY